MKKIVFGFGLLVLLFGLLYISLHGFGKFIFNTQSCERFNIDNIELRTGVNIPKVTVTECKCKHNTKFSKFKIDTNTVNLDDYVLKNNLTPMNDVYIKENENEHSIYKVILDKNNAEITVHLTYKNN